MKLEKMKRCQKAVYGFKGSFTGESLFADIATLSNMIGAEGSMVETKKWGSAKQPAWFMTLTPVGSWGGGGGGSGAVKYTLYVNCDEIATLLTVVSE